jgi:hypothetical protein
VVRTSSDPLGQLTGRFTPQVSKRERSVCESFIDLLIDLALWLGGKGKAQVLPFINESENISSLNRPHHFLNSHATSTGILQVQYEGVPELSDRW